MTGVNTELDMDRSITITQAKQTAPVGKGVLDLVNKSLDDDKADDAVVIDLEGKSAIADYLVIASGTSQRHVGAMADHLQRNLKKAGLKKVAIEGASQCDWVLIDAGDVIVHLFRPEVREFYALEKIWVTPADVGGGMSEASA
jgi:ribosome-associated protein